MGEWRCSGEWPWGGSWRVESCLLARPEPWEKGKGNAGCLEGGQAALQPLGTPYIPFPGSHCFALPFLLLTCPSSPHVPDYTLKLYQLLQKVRSGAEKFGFAYATWAGSSITGKISFTHNIGPQQSPRLSNVSQPCNPLGGQTPFLLQDRWLQRAWGFLFHLPSSLSPSMIPAWAAQPLCPAHWPAPTADIVHAP